MKERLNHFLELEGLTPSRLADIMEIQRSGLSHILSGRNRPGYDFIYKIATKFPSLNLEWLITGKGEVYKSDEEESIIKPVREQLIDFKAPENQISDNKLKDEPRNRTLIKVLLFYSDNSFVEYNAE